MWKQDHPRACGANFSISPVSMGRPGSSPRVRGKRKLAGRPIQHVRIIPARAGQTRRFFHVIIRCTDHPRACGANHRRRRQQGQEGGSSPRVRGKLRRAVPMQSGLRIIPARAGQTSRSSVRTSCFPDHPRACGANELMATTLKQFNGSSPRVRGKRLAVADRLLTNRIIPARAGQTKTLLPTFCPHSDHPRACGANCPAGKSRGCVYGSSPRVRGKLGADDLIERGVRIIPARAGQTFLCGGYLGDHADHPRACGANLPPAASMVVAAGSSPRVRGKPLPGDLDKSVVRIIPARAGQTVRFYAKTLERWTLNNWIRTVAPIFVLLFLLPVIGQNAYIERHYSNQSFSWFSKLHYASAFDLSLVA